MAMARFLKTAKLARRGSGMVHIIMMQPSKLLTFAAIKGQGTDSSSMTRLHQSSLAAISQPTLRTSCRAVGNPLHPKMTPRSVDSAYCVPQPEMATGVDFAQRGIQADGAFNEPKFPLVSSRC